MGGSTLAHDPMDRSSVGGPTLAHDPVFEALVQDGNGCTGMADPVAACYAFESNPGGAPGNALSPLGLFDDHAMTGNGLLWSSSGPGFGGVSTGPTPEDAIVDRLRTGMVRLAQ